MAALGTMTSSASTRPGPPALASSAWRHHALEHEGQLGADLRLLVRREHVEDAVDGLHAAVGVQRARSTRWPVSAMISAASMVSRSRISPTSTTSGSCRRMYLSAVLKLCGVGAHLALVDEAVLVRVQVLDRILDRHDVLVTLGVDLVDDRRERGALARAGGAGDQHQAARLLRRARPPPAAGPAPAKVRILKGMVRKAPATAPRCMKRLARKRESALHAEGEVELVVLLELVLLRVGEDRVAELLGLHRRERRGLQRHQLAVDAELRRASRW